MKSIKDFRVEKNAMAVWWLGQNGYIFKSPEGTLISIDLYLSDSCEYAYPGMNLRRKVPVLIAPENVEVDVYACTHNHLDHLDPDTIQALHNKETIAFVGEGSANRCIVEREWNRVVSKQCGRGQYMKRRTRG